MARSQGQVFGKGELGRCSSESSRFGRDKTDPRSQQSCGPHGSPHVQPPGTTSLSSRLSHRLLSASTMARGTVLLYPVLCYHL